MADVPPQLGAIPKTSELNVPTLSTSIEHDEPTVAPTANGSTAMDSANNNSAGFKDAMVNNTQSAMDTISNHPITQNIKETVNNAPVAEAVKDQHAKTSAEFSNLVNSRKPPSSTAANNQPLTHYHSFFYTLLSWENPRITGIAFASTILTIFAFRYVPALRWTFKILYITLGTIALVESAAKLLFGAGVAQSMRPRRYITIPRESLEASLEDVEQLINFFVIEFQRILYAENVVHTIAAFAASLTSYYLIKFVPLWGLALIATSVVYLTPLIYISNQELIDHHLSNANDIMAAQATQVRELAGQHGAKAASTLKGYAGDYTAKAQEMIGSATGKGRSASPEVTVKSEDFPRAPKTEPKVNASSVAEPQLAS